MKNRSSSCQFTAGGCSIGDLRSQTLVIYVPYTRCAASLNSCVVEEAGHKHATFVATWRLVKKYDDGSLGCEIDWFLSQTFESGTRPLVFILINA